jgi:hypothetical protein
VSGPRRWDEEALAVERFFPRCDPASLTWHQYHAKIRWIEEACKNTDHGGHRASVEAYAKTRTRKK